MRCPQCQRDWPAEFRVCPLCVVPVVSSAAHAEGHSIATTGDGNISVGGSVLGSIYHIYQSPGGPRRLNEAEFKHILNDYLTWVLSEYRYARLHGLQALQSSGAKRKPLSAVYTSLSVTHQPAVVPGGRPTQASPTTAADVREGARPAGPGAAPRRIDMADLLTLGPRVVITGGPGSGKTTYLAFVASSLAAALGGEALDLRLTPPHQERPRRIPILVPLRFWNIYRRACASDLGLIVKQPGEGSLEGFLLWYLRHAYQDFEAAGDFFDRLLRGGGALIMLDGLDEVVGQEERLVVRDAVSRLLDRLPGADNQCLVTAREAGYRDAPFGEDFLRCDIQPMSPEQIAALVHAWCQDIPELERAEAHMVRVIGELNAERAERGQEPLVSTPLLVTMIVSVYYSQRELPQERAKLYGACVDVILQAQYGADADEMGARQALITWGGPPDKQREWLSYLAFQMHRAGPGGIVIDEARVRSILELALRERGEWNLLEPFIESLRRRGGLFEERGAQFQFLHPTFQEYLAAQYLAQQWRQYERGELAAWVDDPWWREVLLLTVGSLDSPVPYEQRRAFIQTLLGVRGSVDTRLAAAELAGTGLLDLTRAEPGLLGVVHARLARQLTDPALLAQTRPLTRARAADTLARLPGGDVRPGLGVIVSTDGYPPLPQIVWCPVPAGPFQMGSDRAHDPAAFTNELPQHLVTIAHDYYIASLPVTNAQFAVFIAAEDGYWQDRWWTPAGLAWRQDWPIAGRYGGVFDLPNHPVVGVSWYEAVAFCQWLTARFSTWDYGFWIWREGKIENLKSVIEHPEVRLPTEAEWERAASWRANAEGGHDPANLPGAGGEKRRYPWGNIFDEQKCNADETGLGTTCAVGLFLAGASACGALDMAGNVWEWCATKWQNTYRDYQDDHDLAGEAARALRGGAFDSDRRSVRCAYRIRDWPGRQYRNVGFRPVLAPRPLPGQAR